MIFEPWLTPLPATLTLCYRILSVACTAEDRDLSPCSSVSGSGFTLGEEGSWRSSFPQSTVAEAQFRAAMENSGKKAKKEPPGIKVSSGTRKAVHQC